MCNYITVSPVITLDRLNKIPEFSRGGNPTVPLKFTEITWSSRGEFFPGSLRSPKILQFKEPRRMAASVQRLEEQRSRNRPTINSNLAGRAS